MAHHAGGDVGLRPKPLAGEGAAAAGGGSDEDLTRHIENLIAQELGACCLSDLENSSELPQPGTEPLPEGGCRNEGAAPLGDPSSPLAAQGGGETAAALALPWCVSQSSQGPPSPVGHGGSSPPSSLTDPQPAVAAAHHSTAPAGTTNSASSWNMDQYSDVSSCSEPDTDKTLEEWGAWEREGALSPLWQAASSLSQNSLPDFLDSGAAEGADPEKGRRREVSLSQEEEEEEEGGDGTAESLACAGDPFPSPLADGRAGTGDGVGPGSSSLGVGVPMKANCALDGAGSPLDQYSNISSPPEGEDKRSFSGEDADDDDDDDDDPRLRRRPVDPKRMQNSSAEPIADCPQDNDGAPRQRSDSGCGPVEAAPAGAESTGPELPAGGDGEACRHAPDLAEQYSDVSNCSAGVPGNDIPGPDSRQDRVGDLEREEPSCLSEEACQPWQREVGDSWTARRDLDDSTSKGDPGPPRLVMMDQEPGSRGLAEEDRIVSPTPRHSGVEPEPPVLVFFEPQCQSPGATGKETPPSRSSAHDGSGEHRMETSPERPVAVQPESSATREGGAKLAGEEEATAGNSGQDEGAEGDVGFALLAGGLSTASDSPASDDASYPDRVGIRVQDEGPGAARSLECPAGSRRESEDSTEQEGIAVSSPVIRDDHEGVEDRGAEEEGEAGSVPADPVPVAAASFASPRRVQRLLFPVVILKKSPRPDSGRMVYRCGQCHERVADLSRLIEHHHVHAGPPPGLRPCTTCGRFFTSEGLARAHLCGQWRGGGALLFSGGGGGQPGAPAWRSGGRMKCKHCSLRFQRRYELLKHERKHTGVTPYRCKQCGRYFAQSSSLNRHMKSAALGGKWSTCKPGKSEVADGEKRGGGSGPRLTWIRTPPQIPPDHPHAWMARCYVKLVDFRREPGEQPGSGAAAQAAGPHACGVCGKAFRKQSLLLVHSRAHADERPFKCFTCPKTFKFSCNRYSHMKLKCAGSAAHRARLMARLKNAEGGPYKCVLCPRLFKYSFNRLRHMRHQCLKEFAQRGLGRKGGLYKCALCSSTFSNTSNRNRHMRQVCLKDFTRREQRRARKDTPDPRRRQELQSWRERGKADFRHQCPHCPATFAFSSGKSRHMHKHQLAEKAAAKTGAAPVPPHAPPEARPQGSQGGEEGPDAGGPHPFPCCYCQKSFRKLHQLKTHQRTHTGERPYRCQECGNSFVQSAHLRRHLLTHRKKIRCLVCKKVFGAVGDLIKHRQAHAQKGALQCPECPQQFKYPSFLRRHLRAHQRRGPLACEVCERSFAGLEQYHQHLDSHRGQTEFTCATCGSLFSSLRALKLHRNFHVSKRPGQHRCRYCGKLYSSSGTLVRHVRIHTGEKPFRCYGCGQRFARQEALKAHGSKCPGPPADPPAGPRKGEPEARGADEPFKCRFCPKTFSWGSSLYKHHMNHRDKVIFPCSKCGRCYSKLWLGAHERSCEGPQAEGDGAPPSAGVGTYSCGRCGRCFSQKDNRDVHQRRCPAFTTDSGPPAREDDRKFKCRYCPKSFMWPSSLTKHHLNHKDNVVWPCSKCGRCYRKVRLAAHERSCDGPQPDAAPTPSAAHANACSKCGRRFAREYYLNVHQSKCRGPRAPGLPAELTAAAAPANSEDGAAEEEEEGEGEKKFKCSYCPKSFVWPGSLEKHHQNHREKKVFPCYKCGQCFRKAWLGAHERACSFLQAGGASVFAVLKPHACGRCGQGFVRTDNRDAHQRTCGGLEARWVTQEEPAGSGKSAARMAKCPHCPKFFSMGSKLRRHVLIHTGVRPFPCVHCGRTFPRMDQCCSHEARCSGVFRARGRRDAGAAREPEGEGDRGAPEPTEQAPPPPAGEGEGKYRCKFCGKAFSRSRNLRRHILTHTDVKPYRCESCGSCFSRYDHLKVHRSRCRGRRLQPQVRMVKLSLGEPGAGPGDEGPKREPQEDEGVYRCAHCDKVFYIRTSLARHVAMLHTVNKPFRCLRCSHTFTMLRALKSHQLKCRGSAKAAAEAPSSSSSGTQTDPPQEVQEEAEEKPCRETTKLLIRIQRHYSDLRPFRCSYCGLRFKTKSQRESHIRLHTGEKPFGCASCGQHFMRRDYLKRHLFKCKALPSPAGRPAPGQSTLCDRCGEIFASWDRLLEHQGACVVQPKSPDRHARPPAAAPPGSPKQTKGFSCATCGERFLLFSQLQHHFLSLHREDSYPLGSQRPGRTGPPSDRPPPPPPHVHIKQEPADEGYDQSHQTAGPPPPLGQGSPPGDAPEPVQKPCVCPHCAMRFCNQSALSMHVRTHSGEWPFSCSRCHKAYLRRDLLNKHQKRCRVPAVAPAAVKAEPPSDFDPRASFSSEDMVLVINSRSRATGTGVLQTAFSCKPGSKESPQPPEPRGSGQFQCSRCDQGFPDGLLLVAHLEEHGREDWAGRGHPCDQCGKTFASQSLLLSHRKLHGVRLPYACGECPRTFRFASDLERHKAFHDPEKPFPCGLCGLRFGSSTALAQHCTARHRGTGGHRYRCPQCSRIYMTLKSYRRHCRLKHEEGQRVGPLLVPVLPGEQQQPPPPPPPGEEEEEEVDVEVEIESEGEGGKAEDEEEEEEEEEDDDEDSDSAPYFPCHVCGKTFTTSESLEDHQRCHLGEKPHECAECGRCFFQLAHLQQHQRSHKTEFQCLLCGRGFVSLFALRKHKRTHGKGRPHRCPRCALSFRSPSSLAAHLATHRGDNFPCDLCDLTFSCKLSRALHREAHAAPGLLPPSPPLPAPDCQCAACLQGFPDPGQLAERGCGSGSGSGSARPYSCPDCGQRFPRGSDLKKHQLSHQLQKSLTYQCTRCHMAFAYLTHFTNHMKRHAREGAGAGGGEDVGGNQCPYCPRSFATFAQLSKHLGTHAAAKPYQCHTCGKRFMRKSNLTVHQRSHVGQAQYECTECGGSFLGIDAFRQHSCARWRPAGRDRPPSPPSASPRPPPPPLSGPEPELEPELDPRPPTGSWEEPPSLECPVCAKRFSCPRKLREHQRCHSAKRPFQCPACGKRFLKPAHLRKHQEVHQRQYACAKCPHTFSSMRAYLQHQGRHSRERPHQCAACLQRFATASELARHEGTHAEAGGGGEGGVFQCDMCWKTFSQAAYLRRHQESHVGEVVYECTECDKAFASFQLLQQHQGAHAPPPPPPAAPQGSQDAPFPILLMRSAPVEFVVNGDFVH